MKRYIETMMLTLESTVIKLYVEYFNFDEYIDLQQESNSNIQLHPSRTLRDDILFSIKTQAPDITANILLKTWYGSYIIRIVMMKGGNET